MTFHSRSHPIPLIVGGLLFLAGAGSLMEAGDPALPRGEHRFAGGAYIGGGPSLDTGFKDWEFCELNGRVEAHPGLFYMPKWGPATILGASGCGSCSGVTTYNGDPNTAGLGLALAPPHDFSSDAGQLPPGASDHPFVLADTGEVVYTEIDFTLPGQGLDFVFARTYRSGMDFEGWCGYGWGHTAELYMIEQGNGDVKPVLGDSRTEDMYEECAVHESLSAMTLPGESHLGCIVSVESSLGSAGSQHVLPSV